LIGEVRRAERFAEVFGLHQLRVRVDLANRAHCQNCRATLIQQRTRKTETIHRVRIPAAVQGAKTSGGKRFIHRRIRVEPRIALRDGARVFCKLFGKGGVEQVRVARTAAVVQQADDGMNVELTQACEARICPRPIGVRQDGDRNPAT